MFHCFSDTGNVQCWVSGFCSLPLKSVRLCFTGYLQISLIHPRPVVSCWSSSLPSRETWGHSWMAWGHSGGLLPSRMIPGNPWPYYSLAALCLAVKFTGHEHDLGRLLCGFWELFSHVVPPSFPELFRVSSTHPRCPELHLSNSESPLSFASVPPPLTSLV